MSGILTQPKVKKKLKIITKGKSYDIADSPLFRLRSKRKLAALLGGTTSSVCSTASKPQYSVFDIKKGQKTREIQAPVLQLNKLHTRIASLLARIKTPDFVHSGVKGRSNVTNALSHSGDVPLLTMDIESFYPSVSQKSVYHLFRDTFEMSADAAGLLANLCTYDGHVPTGSRLSMLLAYWCNHKLFSKLNKLSKDRSITMTLFVDDLTFSGSRVNREFKNAVSTEIARARLTVNNKKTKLYDAARPKLVTGAVLTREKAVVRNKHRKAIHADIVSIRSSADEKEKEKLLNKVRGRLVAASQIEASYKDYARNLKHSL